MSFLSKLPDEHRQRFEAIAAGWRVEFAPEGYRDELQRFADELEELYRSLSGTAELNPLEPNYS